jgi:hypothetical protein
MTIHYCDLCSAPLKDEYFLLYLTSVKEVKNMHELTSSNYQQALNQMQQKCKEICPNCKDVYDRLFELRLENVSELACELVKMFALPSKVNKRKSNGKKEG